MRTVFCGLTSVDLIQRVESVPGPNQKIVSDSALLDVGGPTANAARTAGAHGAFPTLVSPIGPGVFGSLALGWLRESEVRVVDLADDGDPAISAVAIDSLGNRAVVFSNHGHSTVRARCTALGAEHFFDKSFQLDDLLDFIQAAVARH